MIRNIEVLFKPEKDDPYEQDYQIRIGDENFTNVIHLNMTEWYDLLDQMNALEIPIKDPKV